MKKIIVFILCFVIILMCILFFSKKDIFSSDLIKELRNDDNFKYLTDVKGDVENDIIASNYSILIDNKGNMYEYNIRKLYSNDTNFKFVGNDYIGIYSFGAYKRNCEKLDKDGSIDKSLIDNCIYKFINNEIFITNENVLYYGDVVLKSEISSNESIVAVYNQSQNDYYIRTDKAFYRIKKYKKNKAECDKYVDVECVFDYKVVKDNVVSKYIDYIKFIGFDGDYFDIVLNNNEVYRILKN